MKLRILHRAMEGYVPGEYLIADLVTIVRLRMEAVAEIYQRIIYQQQSLTADSASDAPFEFRGMPEPGTADQSISRSCSTLLLTRQAFIRSSLRQDLSLQTRDNLFRFLCRPLRVRNGMHR